MFQIKSHAIDSSFPGEWQVWSHRSSHKSYATINHSNRVPSEERFQPAIMEADMPGCVTGRFNYFKLVEEQVSVLYELSRLYR
jgi:hypothetical protein